MNSRWRAAAGPAQTRGFGGLQAFLEQNGLQLVLRSHEGPDARWHREDLPSMAAGFTVDHLTPAGRLMTVFSAPDYPQFQVQPLCGCPCTRSIRTRAPCALRV